MAASQLIDGDNRKLWAVCPQPDGQVADPEWFQSREAALAFKDQILFPASMDGALLPSPAPCLCPMKG
jgi:hypothetical protein